MEVEGDHHEGSNTRKCNLGNRGNQSNQGSLVPLVASVSLQLLSAGSFHGKRMFNSLNDALFHMENISECFSA